MILLKLFTASFFFVIIFISCSNEPEPNPIIPVAKGTIKGFVFEANTNTPIYYAVITTNPYTKEIFTNIDGSFILTDITTGDYVVYAYQEGYDNDSVFVTVIDKDTATANLSLVNFSEYLDYYPLDIGNYWEYWHGDSPLFSLEVISDTTISGKIYRVIRYKSLTSQNTDYSYERVDEYNAMVYRYFPFYLKEMIIDSLPAKAGQEFSSNMFFHPDVRCYSICNSIKVEEIFGEPKMIRSLSHACATDLPSYQIIKGLGLYSASFWRAGGYKLKYAIIKGVEYGTNN
jgi:hypothetical protein